MKIDYSEKINRLKTTSQTSLRLLGFLWSIDKWLLAANAIAVTIPAIIPFAFAYIFKLLIDQVVSIVAGAPANFNLVMTILIFGFVIYVIQSLSF